MKKVIGSIIIIFGLLILLSNYNLINIDNLWDYIWTVFLIMIGSAGLSSKKQFDFFYGSLIIIGSFYLLESLNIISNEFVNLTLWPILIIGLGVTFFFRIDQKHISNSKHFVAILSGVEEKINDEYLGSEISAIFGGVELDLTKAKFKTKKTYINAQAICGGIDVRVPENVKVVTNGFPILGGIDNKSISNNKADYELIINYNIICGGIEIKN
ncbi:MAG: DUF5668 domain-containing protein [Bacilli bacterium]|nr:DUF5668 domain-containing protein [Bacilli bacterium]